MRSVTELIQVDCITKELLATTLCSMAEAEAAAAAAAVAVAMKHRATKQTQNKTGQAEETAAQLGP